MKVKFMPAVLAAYVLLASAVQVSGEEDVARLADVVVTATGTEISKDKAGGNTVTVITEKDIEAMKATSVSEVIKTVPGLDIAANGGPGTSTSVFLRGADAKNTLVLVDGVMMNDPSSANRSADLANLTVDNIERIEVVKGPMSVMYGSNAASGVVNIITKKGKGPLSLFADISAGSYGTVKTGAGMTGRAQDFSYSLSASGTRADGFSVADDRNGKIDRDGNTREKDGYENLTLSGRAGYDFSKDTGIDLVARYTDASTELDDYGSGYAGDAFVYDPVARSYSADPSSPHKRKVDTRQSLAKASLKNAFFERALTTNLSYSCSDQKREYTNNDGSDGGFYKGGNQEIGFQGDLNFDTNTLSAGVTFGREYMESAAMSGKDADTLSVRIQDRFMPSEQITILIGTRLDDHDRFGSKATYRVAPSYTLSSGTCLKASYGTGFRSPSLFELYDPTYGNKDLGPEESRGWDFGVEQSFKEKTVSLGATYFNMVFDDRIVYDFATSHYNQLDGETKTSGVESYVGWSPLSVLDVTLSCSYTESKDPNGARLQRRPYNKYLMNVRYGFLENASVNLDVRYAGKRHDSASAKDRDGNRIRYLEPYTLVNLSASFKMAKHVEIYGRVDNLFDEYYEECWSYAMPGISGYVGVKLAL
jgi:vitamin B12 transporter